MFSGIDIVTRAGRGRRVFLVLAVLWPAAAPATERPAWVLDEGVLEVTARFEGQPVPGRFQRFQVRFHPPREGEPGRVRVLVDVSSLRFDMAEVTTAVHGEEWLDSATFGQAVYEGPVLAPGGRLVAEGVLELKGVRRAVQVPMSWEPAGVSGRLRGAVTLDRTRFGVGPADPEVAAGVEVRFDLVLRRGKVP